MQCFGSESTNVSLMWSTLPRQRHCPSTKRGTTMMNGSSCLRRVRQRSIPEGRNTWHLSPLFLEKLSWGLQRLSWAHVGPSWGPLGTLLGRLQALVGPPLAVLGPSWPPGESLGAVLGASWGPPGPSWGVRLGCLGALLGRLGAFFELSWTVWGALGPSWGSSGLSLAPPRPCWNHFEPRVQGNSTHLKPKEFPMLLNDFGPPGMSLGLRFDVLQT